MSNSNIYTKNDHSRLRLNFNSCENIETNYSQALQDIFVLSVLDGKRNGTYLEIGADDGISINNTYLLETKYDWKGLAFEWLRPGWERYTSQRKNPCLCEDAITANYTKLLEEYNFPLQIDFLQVDIEPPRNTLNALKAIPHNQYRFSVICFETAIYSGEDNYVQKEQTDFLSNLGYLLVAKNVSNLGGDPFEDWWVDPNTVDINRLSPYLEKEFGDDREKRCLEIIFNN